MTSRKISILLPFRNEARFIGPCLESLARQTCREFELVAVDDGSTDRSLEILESLAGRFHRLIVCKTGGTGLVPALNLGLSRASGSVIARADADDIYHPRRLEAQMGLIEKGIDLAGSLVRFFPRPGILGGFLTYENWLNRLQSHTSIASEIYVETPISHPSLMIRRALLERIGGYRALNWPEDFDMMLRAYRSGAIFGKVDRILHFWREHPQRHCRSDSRYNLDAFIRCRCHHLSRGPLKTKEKVVIWGAGPIGKKTAKYLLEEGVPIEAFIDIDPRKIGGAVRSRRVHDPSFLRKNRCFVLACVGKRNARYLVKSELESLGYREKLDFLLAA